MLPNLALRSGNSSKLVCYTMPCSADRVQIKIKLFNLVFVSLRARREGNRYSVKCRLCRIKIHYRGGQTRVLFQHIKIKHWSIFLASCFNSITPVEWLKLFEYVPTKQGEVHYKFIQCKYCGSKFRYLFSQQPQMLNHLKAEHPSALLTVWKL